MHHVPIVFCAAAAIAACIDPAEPGNLVPRTVDQDPSLPAVDLAGTRLHYETFGSPTRRPLIFLHGGPGGDYRSLLRLRNPLDGRRLEDDHFLVFWDQRGAGLSKRHDADEFTLDRYLADLDAVIDHVANGTKPVLIGKSWGGQYATAYIDRHPDRVAAVVLLEPGPLTGALWEEVKSGIIQIELTGEWFNDYLWEQRFLSPDDHARLDYARTLGRNHSQPGFHLSADDPDPIWRLGAVAINALLANNSKDGKGVWNFVEHTREFSGPVTLVASERNEVIGIDFQTRQAAFFRDPVFAVVDGAGHDFQWTRPEPTIALIRQTLARLGDAASSPAVAQ
jgi:proline iminopeptidase